MLGSPYTVRKFLLRCYAAFIVRDWRPERVSNQRPSTTDQESRWPPEALPVDALVSSSVPISRLWPLPPYISCKVHPIPKAVLAAAYLQLQLHNFHSQITVATAQTAAHKAL
jgi:hypothetical protein